MKAQHRTIRALLRTMSPRRASDYVKSFGLRDDEELVLVQCDICGLSLVEISQNTNFSVEKVSKLRKQAYSKILDAIEHGESLPN